MKLQKVKVMKYKDQDYFKYQISINPKIIKILGWKAGMHIDMKIEHGKEDKLILTKRAE